MCMSFSCNPQIILFFSQFELSHFFAHLLPKHINFGYLLNPTVLLDNFVILRRFGQGLSICMRFSSNPKINFVTYFSSLN